MGRLLTRRPLTNYRKAYGKLRGVTLPELGGNFRLCAVDQKRSFFPRAVPFLGLLPFKRPFPLTGALTGRPPYGKAPYGEASYGEGRPYRKGRSLREGPLRGWVPSQRRTTKRLTGSPLQGRTVLTGSAGPHRDPELGGNFRLCAVDQKRWFFPKGSLREGPLRGWALRREGRRRGLQEAPYREGRSLREGHCRDPELGGNFRLCAVDQKRPFLIRVRPFLDLLPFKGPFPLTGALYGEAPTGRRLTGRFLTGRPLTGRPLTGRLLTGRLLTGRPLTGRPVYGETSYGWAGISACVP